MSTKADEHDVNEEYHVVLLLLPHDNADVGLEDG